MNEPTRQDQPATSPNSVTGLALSAVGFGFGLLGASVLSVLFVIAGLICAVVGLARNEPARAAAAVSLILAVLTFF